MSWSWTEKNANGDDDLKPFSSWLPVNENAFHPFVSFKQQCNQPNVGHWPHCPLHESMVPCQYSHTNFSYSFSLTYFWKSLFLGICEEFFKEQHSRTTGLETYVSSNHLCTPSPNSCLQKKKKLLSLTDTYSTLFTTLCIHNIPFLGPLKLRGGALPTLQKSSVPWVSFSRCLPWSPVCSWTMDLSHCRELRIATEYLDTYSQIVKN